MKLTKHAIKRAQQRGLKHDVLFLISLFGEEIGRDRDGIKLLMSEKTIRKLIQLLDKCRDTVIITDSNYDRLITAYALGH